MYLLLDGFSPERLHRQPQTHLSMEKLINLSWEFLRVCAPSSVPWTGQENLVSQGRNLGSHPSPPNPSESMVPRSWLFYFLKCLDSKSILHPCSYWPSSGLSQVLPNASEKLSTSLPPVWAFSNPPSSLLLSIVWSLCCLVPSPVSSAGPCSHTLSSFPALWEVACHLTFIPSHTPLPLPHWGMPLIPQPSPAPPHCEPPLWAPNMSPHRVLTLCCGDPDFLLSEHLGCIIVTFRGFLLSVCPPPNGRDVHSHFGALQIIYAYFLRNTTFVSQSNLRARCLLCRLVPLIRMPFNSWNAFLMVSSMGKIQLILWGSAQVPTSVKIPWLSQAGLIIVYVEWCFDCALTMTLPPLCLGTTCLPSLYPSQLRLPGLRACLPIFLSLVLSTRVWGQGILNSDMM